jgi:DNA polymerase-3 subunit epsilon
MKNQLNLAKASLLLKFKRLWQSRRLTQAKFKFLFQPPPDNDWVSFDCETTGLNPKTAEILSIGAVKIRGHQILHGQRLELIVKPTGSIQPDSIPIHHIRDQDAREGLSAEEALYQFLDFIGSRPLVGYYIDFDIALINQLTRRYLNTSLPNLSIDVASLYYDEKIGLIPQNRLDLRFETLLNKMEVPRLNQHDAYQDALMTAMLFTKLTSIHKQ